MISGKDVQASALNYYYGRDVNSSPKEGFQNTRVRVDKASCIPWLKHAHWRGEINRILQLIKKEGSSGQTFLSIFTKSKIQISQCEDLYSYIGKRAIPGEIRTEFIENARRLEKNKKNGKARAMCVRAFLDFGKHASCQMEHYRRALIHAYIAVQHDPSEITVQVLVHAQQQYLINLKKRVEYLEDIYSKSSTIEQHQRVIREGKKEKPAKDMEIRSTAFKVSLGNSKAVIEHQIRFFYTKLKKYLEEEKEEEKKEKVQYSRRDIRKKAVRTASQKKVEQKKKTEKQWTYTELKRHEKNGFKSLTKAQKGKVYEYILNIINDLKWFPLCRGTLNGLIRVVDQMTSAGGTEEKATNGKKEETPEENEEGTQEVQKKGILDRLTDAQIGRKKEKVNKLTTYLEALLAYAEGEMKFSIHKASLIEYEQNMVGPSLPFRTEFGIQAQDYHEDISKCYKTAMEKYGKITRSIPHKQYTSQLNFNILKDLVACVLSLCNKQITPRDVTREYLQKNEFLLRCAIPSQHNSQKMDLLRNKMTQLMTRQKVDPIK